MTKGTPELTIIVYSFHDTTECKHLHTFPDVSDMSCTYRFKTKVIRLKLSHYRMPLSVCLKLVNEGKHAYKVIISDLFLFSRRYRISISDIGHIKYAAYRYIHVYVSYKYLYGESAYTMLFVSDHL